jgi:hypothetical protein
MISHTNQGIPQPSISKSLPKPYCKQRKLDVTHPLTHKQNALCIGRYKSGEASDEIMLIPNFKKVS